MASTTLVVPTAEELERLLGQPGDSDVLAAVACSCNSLLWEKYILILYEPR